jgi:nicotinamide phosphoribosyltransferase
MLTLLCDSYKAGHVNLYPPDLEGLYAYFESRGGQYDHTLFFGLQYYLQKYLAGYVLEAYDIAYADQFWGEHFGRNDYFNADEWYNLLADHDGTLPLKIKALPEGSLVPVNTPLFTVESTDENYPWLVTWIETLLMKVWYPTTVATQSYYLKKYLRELRKDSSDTLDGLDFMVHDFGYRGCTSEEQAAIGGAAHLLSFRGTDTVAGIQMLHSYYSAVNMVGFSVPATEHSVILAWGRDYERNAFDHLITKYPDGIVACVSDTYNIYEAVDRLWGDQLGDKVAKRNGTLVVRPDSGDPLTVVLATLNSLGRSFGFSMNDKGLRVLDSHVRVIQGDGMNPNTITDLYADIVEAGWAPENLTVGAGGGMLQSVNRDTQRFAYKVSSINQGGKEIAVAKNPITDRGKASKAGRFSVVRGESGLETFYGETDQSRDLLQTVFVEGKIVQPVLYRDLIDSVEGSFD